tara:strand:+ start:46 stop:537 length:492 start_codon:yes stop_codon:yes gene_type:complete
MNINDFNKGNNDTIKVIESSTELKKLKRYYTADYVKRHIGAAIHSSYSIGYLVNNDFIALDPNQLSFDSEEDVNLYVFGNASFNEEIVNNGNGNIIFSGPGKVYFNNVNVYSGGFIKSTTKGEPSGSYVVDNIVGISEEDYQSAFDNDETKETTLYLTPDSDV